MNPRSFTQRTWVGCTLRSSRRQLAAMGCGLFLCGAGCSVRIPQHKVSPSVHAPEDIALNSEQVRLIMRASVQPLAGIIVEAADRIMNGTTDPVVRRRALVWKIEAVPALREALFLPNAFHAVFDASVLSWQMLDYFQTGPGKDNFGDQQPVAVAACKHLEDEINQLGSSFTTSGDVSRARDLARKFAAENPIETSIASRESILTQASELQVASSFSVAEAVGNITVTLDDLSRRVEIYSAQILDQSRWQAELLVMDMARNYHADSVLPLAERAVQSAARAVETMDRIAPEAERTLHSAGRATESVDRIVPQVERSLGVVEGAPAMITRERQAAIKDLSAELRDIVAQERKALTQDIEQTSIRVVDHAFRQAILLVLIVCASVLVTALLYQFLRRRPASR
jgi:hypothetical protein